MATATVDRSVDLDCSRHDAFEKLSRFDFYALFPGVQDIQARGGNLAHMVIDIHGGQQGFDVALDQVPEERVDLHAVNGPTVASSITLEPLDEQHTRVRLHVEYDPRQLREQYDIDERDVERRVQERLENIKQYAERPGA